jgi:hypothetical protein
MCMRFCAIIALMMRIEVVPETSVVLNQLTHLIVREDFINVSCLESFTLHIILLSRI